MLRFVKAESGEVVQVLFCVTFEVVHTLAVPNVEDTSGKLFLSSFHMENRDPAVGSQGVSEEERLQRFR